MHNRIAIIIICIVLVVATLAGVVVMLIPRNTEDPSVTETPSTTEPNESNEPDDTSGESTTDKRQPELTPHTESHKPIPDLEDGNEIYLDMDVLAKLQEMEDADKEDEVNVILDTMLLLINEFVDRKYSALAIAQVQRFYFTYRNEIGVLEFSELCDKIEACVSEDGANISTFASQVQLIFGFGADADFVYIFDAEVSS